MRLKSGERTPPSFASILFYYIYVCLSSRNALIVPRAQLLARDESSVRHDDHTVMPLPNGTWSRSTPPFHEPRFKTAELQECGMATPVEVALKHQHHDNLFVHNEFFFQNQCNVLSDSPKLNTLHLRRHPFSSVGRRLINPRTLGVRLRRPAVQSPKEHERWTRPGRLHHTSSAGKALSLASSLFVVLMTVFDRSSNMLG